jgi:hypothetical protein
MGFSAPRLHSTLEGSALYNSGRPFVFHIEIELIVVKRMTDVQ